MDRHILLAIETPDSPSADIRGRLAAGGYRVHTASDGREASRLLSHRPGALVLVRVTTNVGVAVCGTLRPLTASPILALCKRSLAVECLEAGADSALSEPVGRRELAARLRALSRSPELPATRRESYHVGELEIDSETHRASVGGRPVDLTPTEFRLLLALARHGGNVVPYDDLIAEVWTGGRPDARENLRLYVRYLRTKLADDPRRPRLVLCHRGVGYALAPAAEKVRVAYA